MHLPAAGGLRAGLKANDLGGPNWAPFGSHPSKEAIDPRNPARPGLE
jgi:hypothetical protein